MFEVGRQSEKVKITTDRIKSQELNKTLTFVHKMFWDEERKFIMKNILKVIFILVATLIIMVNFCACSDSTVESIDAGNIASPKGELGEDAAVSMSAEIITEESASDFYIPMKYAQVQYVNSYEEVTVIGKEGGFAADEDVTKPAINAANQQLELLPDNIWEQFCKMGWTLTLKSEILYMSDGSYGDSTIVGLCNRNNRTITLSAVSSAYIQRSLLHEFGHFVYYQLNTKELSQLMDIYKGNLENNAVAGYSAHCLENENEYFADSFKRYLRGQEVEDNIAAFIESVIPTI